MCYFENEYMVPVLLGDKSRSLRLAKIIFKKYGVKPHVFGFSFTLFEKIKYQCHTFSSKADFIITASLLNFADSIAPYYTALLILCDEQAKELIGHENNILESAYICVYYQDLFEDKSFRGGKTR